MSALGQYGHCIYSITSSARATSVGGIVTPNALAVFNLTTRSNLAGCSTGRSLAQIARVGALQHSIYNACRVYGPALELLNANRLLGTGISSGRSAGNR